MSVIALPRAEAVAPRRGPGWLTLITRRKTTLLGAVLMLVMLVILSLIHI